MKVAFRVFLLSFLLTTYASSPAAQWAQAGGFGAKNAAVTALAGGGQQIFAVVNWRIYSSTDQGTSWQRAGLDSSAIFTIAEERGYLFAATLTGVCRSDDGGKNWSVLQRGYTGETLHLDGQRVFVGSKTGSLFLSTDLGNDWQLLNPNILWGPVTSIVNIGDTILVGTGTVGGEPYDGLFLSRDNGRTWSILLHLNVWSLCISGSKIFAGTDNGIYTSVDGGTTWTPSGLKGEQIAALTVGDNDVFAVTKKGGVFCSADNGASWKGINSGLEINNITAILPNGDNLYVGTNGAGVYLRPLPYNGFFSMFHIVLLVLLVVLATTAIYFRRALTELLSRISQSTRTAPAGHRGGAFEEGSLSTVSATHINKPQKTEQSMKPSLTKYSAGIFVLAGLSFLLPFVAASCNGQQVVTVTGIQLVTGTKVNAPSAYGYSQQREMSPEPLAVLAFIATLTGIVFYFVKGGIGKILSTISGGIGFIFLLLLQSKLNSDAANQGGNLFQINYLTGFWIALILLLVGAIFNLYLLFRERATIGT